MIDITGKKFSRLTALYLSDKRINSRETWMFQCDCGTKKEWVAKSVKSGNTKSCGCLLKITAIEKALKDGTRLEKCCAECSKKFYVKKSHFQRTVVCSMECKSNYFKKSLIGSANPNWKGGFSSDKSYMNNRAKIWREKNLEKISSYNRKNKLKRKKVEGSHTIEDINRIYDLQKGKCNYCSKKVGKNYHIDHVVPISKGGSNDSSNICISCPTCNLKKGPKMPEEWAAQRGLLL